MTWHWWFAPPLALGWLAIGWCVLVGLIAIFGKPNDEEQRTLCGFTLILWPLAIALTITIGTLVGTILGINELVKAACAPGDALANAFGKFVASAKRVHVRRIPTPEMQAAKRELDAYLRGEP